MTEEEILEFIDWYSEQGEQDIAIWFEESKNQGRNVRDWIGMDIKKTYPAVKQKSDEIVTSDVYVLYIKENNYDKPIL